MTATKGTVCDHLPERSWCMPWGDARASPCLLCGVGR